MTTLSNRLNTDWRHIIDDQFDIGDEFDYVAMEQFLRKERDTDPVHPKDEEIFNALNLVPFEKVQAVIIGQDPYHGPGQAHGLCFSTKDKGIPRSLQNIYREIEAECSIKMPNHGDLTGWAAQGVLLLNATLTVREGKAGSHHGKGWEKFTDAVIRAINERDHVVFLLWGRDAQKKRALIGKKHLVLEASHPSPLSARRSLSNGQIHSFCGCGHFIEANKDLKKHKLKPIAWQRI